MTPLSKPKRKPPMAATELSAMTYPERAGVSWTIVVGPADGKGRVVTSTSMRPVGSLTADLLVETRVHGSEVDAGLESGHEGVGNLARPTGPDDVLEVGLEEHGLPAEAKPIGQLERDLVPLDADGRIRRPRAPLSVLQVIAEATVHDAHASHVRRPRREHSADEEPGGGKEGHLTDGLVRRDEQGAGDPETTEAARPAELHQDLVEQTVEAPVSPSDAGVTAAGDGGEVGELTVVVPEAGLVVADQAAVAGKT